MTCRCSSKEEHAERQRRREAGRSDDRLVIYKDKVKELEAELESMQMKSENYEILDCEQVGAHLVLQVKYPSCPKCDYEGTKVMVFLCTPMKEALRWKRIDPHFRQEKSTGRHPTDAPSPAARFPGDGGGWSDAINYAKSKHGDGS